RRPVPVTIMTSALPLAHPGRLTTSWITALRSGVRSFAEVSPELHATGAQPVAAVVRVRVETSPLVAPKAGGLSAACPWRTRLVATLWAVRAVNWRYAAVMVEPAGMVRPVQRMPTV